MKNKIIAVAFLIFATFKLYSQIWNPCGNGMNANNWANKGVYTLCGLNGFMYAGGWFDSAGLKKIKYLARWDGTNWDSLGKTPNHFVYALDTLHSEVFAGGNFDSIGGIFANHIARWDGTSWHDLDSGINGSVSTIRSIDGELFVGGTFNYAANINAECIAKWNGTNWIALGGGMNHVVRSICKFNGEIIAAGHFTIADGLPANYIAKWNGTNWQQLGSGIDNWVESICVYQGELYAGGSFNDAGGIPAASIAKWNGTAWADIGGVRTSMNNSGNVFDMKVMGGELIIAGKFDKVGNSNLIAHNIAGWDGTNWFTLDSGMNNTVLSLGALDSILYCGGHFTVSDGSAGNHIAKYSTVTNILSISSNTNLILYPIPCKNHLNIFSENEKINNLKLINYNGQIIRNEIVNNQKYLFDLSGLNTGVYFLTIKTNNTIHKYTIAKE